MHYQVMARSSESSGSWEYYPYWAPIREKSAAERLATYAAQSGCEAAILQSVTIEMLENLASRVAERQEVDLLPSLRYLPGSPTAQASHRRQCTVEMPFVPSPVLDPYIESIDKAELDVCRLNMELGPGGDILTRNTVQPGSRLPLRMDILSVWLRLREKVISGKLGSQSDGATEDDHNASA